MISAVPPSFYKVYHLITEDEISLTSSVLAESALAVTHILLSCTFAKPLIIPMFPRTE